MPIGRIITARSALQNVGRFKELMKHRIKEQRPCGGCQHLAFGRQELSRLGFVS
jgi:hypothetical protein